DECDARDDDRDPGRLGLARRRRHSRRTGPGGGGVDRTVRGRNRRRACRDLSGPSRGIRTGPVRPHRDRTRAQRRRLPPTARVPTGLHRSDARTHGRYRSSAAAGDRRRLTDDRADGRTRHRSEAVPGRHDPHRSDRQLRDALDHASDGMDRAGNAPGRPVRGRRLQGAARPGRRSRLPAGHGLPHPPSAGSQRLNRPGYPGAVPTIKPFSSLTSSANEATERRLPRYAAGQLRLPMQVLGSAEPTEHGTDWAEQSHPTRELLWRDSGLGTVTIGARTWTITPPLGMWIPAGVPHSGWTPAGVVLNAAQFDVAQPPVGDAPTAIRVHPLLRLLLERL